MTNKDSTLTSGDNYFQISTNSSLSCESDISSFSFDKEVDSYTNRIDDELPAFEIRLLSPHGRSPSPIDSDLEFIISSPTKSCITPTRSNSSNKKPHNTQKNNEDFVLLHDINAQISPPSDSESSKNKSTCVSPQGNLETIFEGIFLNTPPKQSRIQIKSNGSGTNKQRNSLLEKIAINRLNFVPSSGDKENLRTKDIDSDIVTATTTTPTDDG